MASGGHERSSLAEPTSTGDSSSLRQRLLNQPRPSTASDDLGSIASDEMDGQLNSILNGDRETSRFRFRDLFSPKQLILLLWNSMHRATFGTICILVILWAAIFIYVSFYYIYIPALDVSHAIHFQFDTVCKDKCSVPFANIQLSQYKQPTFFAKGQQYRISVLLDVPESDINWEQGMFMLKITLSDNNQNDIITNSRAGILRYKSPLLRLVSTIVYWPLLVTGLKSEHQQLAIPLIENYVDGIKPKAGTATSAIITLEARTIQIYSSSLIVQANLTGLRYLMVNWPITTGLVGVATIFTFLSIITVCGIYRAVNDDIEESEYDHYEKEETNSELAQSEDFSSMNEPTPADSIILEE